MRINSFFLTFACSLDWWSSPDLGGPNFFFKSTYKNIKVSLCSNNCGVTVSSWSIPDPNRRLLLHRATRSTMNWFGSEAKVWWYLGILLPGLQPGVGASWLCTWLRRLACWCVRSRHRPQNAVDYRQGNNVSSYLRNNGWYSGGRGSSQCSESGSALLWIRH